MARKTCIKAMKNLVSLIATGADLMHDAALRQGKSADQAEAEAAAALYALFSAMNTAAQQWLARNIEV